MELKNSAAKTATAALNGINSLLGGNKVSRLESENRQLHGEVTELKGSIEQLCTDMQKMRDSHTAEQLRASEQHQREVGNLRRIIDKAKEWFPMLAEFLRIERLCRSVGLSEKHTEELLQGKVLVVTGKLRSEEGSPAGGQGGKGRQDRTRPARGQSADCHMVQRKVGKVSPASSPKLKQGT